MRKQIFKYSLLIISTMIVFACRQAKYVADGNYLHKKNTIYFENLTADGDTTKEKEQEGIADYEMYDLIKPVPNKGFKLFVYNRIDTARHQKQLTKKRNKVNKKNQKRKTKEDKINAKRIEKSKRQGKEYYNHKTKNMKEMKYGWRDWVVNHMGQLPSLYDSAAVEKSRAQLDIYLTKRGYYDATVSDSVYFKEKKQKSYAEYYVTTGQPYVIDSFALDASADANMRNMYRKFVKADKSVIVLGAPIDEDILELERENFSKYCRDEGAYYGFNKSYITFEVDTLGKGHNAVVYMHFIPKKVEHPLYKDSLVTIPHQTYYVNNMTFLLHNPYGDTSTFKYGYYRFKMRCDSLGLDYSYQQKYVLLDTLINIDTLFKKGAIDSIYYKGVFIYNDKPFLNPDLIDKQNFLYRPHYAKEYYLERTYRTMLQLDVFSSITPIIEIDPNNPMGNKVNVTYHLVPAKKQTFTIEPRVTNTNSIMGLMGSITYTNKNLFGGAQKLKVSFVGGFEAQPSIVGDDVDQKRYSLNTFEWGPTIQLQFPKLVPMTKRMYEQTSKRAYPSTKFDLAVNIQRREEFRRRLAHFAYQWNFKISKDQGKIDEIGLQFVNFDFVRLIKEQFFIDKLNLLNDPFVLNSYADHFSLFNGIFYKTDNQIPNEYNKVVSILQFTFLQSGGILNATGIGKNNLSADSLKQVFGVPFTQFLRIDAQHLFQFKITRKQKIATRVLMGAGYAYGNSPSLPYEQSFYAGGSNDIRAFDARTMAPGGIRIYEDSTATLTQIGDMRLELNLEYRFKMNSLLEGAIFVDMGNIWKIQDDPTTTKDDLGVFGFGTFYKQVAIGGGFGLRADLEFLIVRFDIALPIHNPYLPAGERWFGTPHPTYIATWDQGPNGNNNGIIDPIKVNKDGTIVSGDTNGNGAIDIWDEAKRYHHPFVLNFNFGIGYPF